MGSRVWGAVGLSMLVGCWGYKGFGGSALWFGSVNLNIGREPLRVLS